MFAQDISESRCHARQKNVLLVVDDNEYVAETTVRHLASKFDSVFAATDPHRATQILEEHQVSHILCGFCLGLDASRSIGFVFSSFWRNEFPDIRRIVIFTGEAVPPQAIPGDVDAVIPKTSGIEGMFEALQV